MKSTVAIYKGKPYAIDFYKTPQGVSKQIISIDFHNDVTLPDLEDPTQIYVAEDTLFVFTPKDIVVEDGDINVNSNRVNIDEDIIVIN